MSFEIAPNRIELTDLTGGLQTDAAEAAVGPSGTPDVLNLLPEPWGNELRLRAGYYRESAGRVSALAASHYLKQLFYFEAIVSHERKRYILAVFSNGQDNVADNIRIYVYDLNADTFTRVDTAGRAWAKANRDWWHAVVEGTIYLGTRGEAPVSWEPTAGYNASPFTPNVNTWVDSITPGAGEIARDYGFKKGQKVIYSGQYYTVAKDNRFDIWKTGQRYKKGQRVSRKTAIGGQTYWRSYDCIKSHTAGTDNDQPGTGANTDTYWSKKRIQDPQDDDGQPTRDWFLNPVVRKTGVGVYHGNRLFVRADDNDNFARLQYSAPAKPEEGATIADLTFDPTDWAAVDTNDGDGGGWFNVPMSGKGDGIRALVSLGNYLIIMGRWQSYVLSGTNESTWTLRKLGDYGALSNTATCTLDGIVYSLSRQGVLVQTDGTTMQVAPGMEKMRRTFKAAIDHVLNSGGDETVGDQNWFVSMEAHDGFIWMSMPTPADGSSNVTYVYDPRTASFWKLDLQILSMTVGEDKGVQRLWFSTAISGASGQSPCLFRYADDPGNTIYTDDDWQAQTGTTATNDISYRFRSAWFQFGMTHNERRLRRAWVLMGGEAASTVTMRMYRNFLYTNSNSYVTTVDRTLTGQATKQAEFVEAKVGQTTSIDAVAVRVSGTANAPVSLHGAGVDTEPLRTRFHK